MLLSRCEECETSSVRGLDLQLIHQVNQIAPGLLVRIDDIPNLVLGRSVHPWVQKGMRDCLVKLFKRYPTLKLKINSAYRTIVGQALLFSHGENDRCEIKIVSPPGRSNHNNASSFDIENWAEDHKDEKGVVRSIIDILEDFGFTWLGHRMNDKMHFDCDGCIDMRSISIKAFQYLWNYANPSDKLAVDGDYGQLVASRLRVAPIEGFPNLPPAYPPRILKYTEPLQAGNDVGKLQLDLRAAGIDIGKADKIFGAGLDKAVKTYQAKVGMVADGVVGRATLLALNPSAPPNIA
jgi:N-acetylmuramoyl-L-alanine amidase